MITKTYRWKTLSEDGLLKEPRPYGPYYDEDSFNKTFTSEEEAIKYIHQLENKHDYFWENLILVTTYECRPKDKI